MKAASGPALCTSPIVSAAFVPQTVYAGQVRFVAEAAPGAAPDRLSRERRFVASERTVIHQPRARSFALDMPLARLIHPWQSFHQRPAAFYPRRMPANTGVARRARAARI